MQLSRNGTSCATCITLQRKPLLLLLVCRGDSPEFPVEVANRYYPEKYQVPVRLQQGHLSWFPFLSEDKFGHAFDMSRITPSLVRKVLSSKKATSLPGPDVLMYGVLLQLPSKHSFLSTLLVGCF
jgi:hypothetical protein